MEDVKTHNDELFHLFLNLGAIPKNRTPGKFTHIQQTTSEIEIATKCEKKNTNSFKQRRFRCRRDEGPYNGALFNTFYHDRQCSWAAAYPQEKITDSHFWIFLGI